MEQQVFNCATNKSEGIVKNKDIDTMSQLYNESGFISLTNNQDKHTNINNNDESSEDNNVLYQLYQCSKCGFKTENSVSQYLKTYCFRPVILLTSPIE